MRAPCRGMDSPRFFLKRQGNSVTFCMRIRSLVTLSRFPQTETVDLHWVYFEFTWRFQQLNSSDPDVPLYPHPQQFAIDQWSALVQHFSKQVHCHRAYGQAEYCSNYHPLAFQTAERSVKLLPTLLV